MGRKADAGCCAPGEEPHSYERNVELGNRRRSRLIRVSAAASALLCFGGIATPILSQAGIAAEVAERLLWATVLLGAPLMLTHVRRLMTGSGPSWQLVAGAGLLAVGLLGHPIVPAVGAALALIMRTLLPAPTGSCPDGCTNECCATTTPDAAEFDAAGARRAG